jgi:hypothetical protein
MYEIEPFRSSGQSLGTGGIIGSMFPAGVGVAGGGGVAGAGGGAIVLGAPPGGGGVVAGGRFAGGGGVFAGGGVIGIAGLPAAPVKPPFGGVEIGLGEPVELLVGVVTLPIGGVTVAFESVPLPSATLSAPHAPVITSNAANVPVRHVVISYLRDSKCRQGVRKRTRAAD